MLMANSFCRFLGNQLRIDLQGSAPCCWYQEKVNVFDYSQFKTYYNELLSVDDWTPNCNYCFQKEQTGQISPRQHSLNNYKFFGLPSGIEPDQITSLEIQTDSDCNGACLICGPSNSTTWQKFESKFQSEFIIKDERNNVQSKFDIIKKNINFHNLRKLGFVNGGEPLRTDTHIIYLKYLEEINHLQNVSINYVTNGSIKPSKQIIKLWKNAKEVILNISIDGINDHFNYLRWPLKFDQVIDNINFILELNLQGRLSFSYAITPLNAFYHNEYVNWSNQFFKNYKGSFTVNSIFKFPFNTVGNINMSCVPPTLKIEIFKKYGPSHVVSKLIETFNLQNYRQFLNYIKTQDYRRNLSFRETFPEVEQHFLDF